MDISNNNDDDNKPSTYVLNGKIMLCSVIILFIVVFVVACFHSYVRLCFHREHPRRRRIRRRRLLSDSIYPTETSVSSKGLDISILKTMPTFTYNAVDNDHRLDCAVCLSEFAGREHGRVLPNCKHVFHIDCIDPWFRSHSNCPLCRSPVQPVILAPTSQFRDEVVITVSEPAGSERLEDEKGSSRYSPSTSFSTEECGREPLDLVGMSMEDRLSNLRNSGKSSHGSKCSGNQVLYVNEKNMEHIDR